MKLSEAIKLRVNNLLIQKGFNKYKLSINAGLAPSTISTFMKKDSIPQLDTILHVCEGFGITLGEFFTDEIFNDVEED